MEHTRKHGTIVTDSQSSDERINAIRRVVKQAQYAKIDGQMADLFTCSTICKVYDALNDANKLKFASIPYAKMANVAFRLMK